MKRGDAGNLDFDSASTLYSKSQKLRDLTTSTEWRHPHLPAAHGDGHTSDTGQPSVVSDFTALLLPFGDDFFSWNHDAYTNAIGTTFVTFSFSEADGLPDPLTLPYSVDSVFSYTSAQRDQTRAALELFTAVTGIIFIETEDDGMIDFIGISGSTVGGYAYYPDLSRNNSGGVAIDSNVGTDWNIRTTGWYVLLHEIGHALGLKHPFEGDVILDPSVNNHDYTVMSYSSGNGAVVDLGELDIAALQFLYGSGVDLGASGLAFDWDEASDILTVRGGALSDAISGVAQTNHIEGGEGDDFIFGGAGQDILSGGNGNDTIVTGFGNAIANGDDGNDILRSNGFQSQLFGGAGDDLFEYLWASLLIDGGDGFDTVALTASFGGFFDLSSSGVVSIEQVLGGVWDDSILGSGLSETIRSGSGDDTVYGSGGADILDGGDGVDTLNYSLSDAAISVNLGIGLASGGYAEGDTITRFENVTGSSYADVLIGDGHDNTFLYSGGADTIDGSAGFDTLSLEFLSSDLRINVASGTLEFRSDEFGQYFSLGLGPVTSIEAFITGSGDDLLIGGVGNDAFNAGTGNNTLMGGAGVDLAIHHSDISQVSVIRLANGDVYVGRSSSSGFDHNISIETFDFAGSLIDAQSVSLFNPLEYVASHTDLISVYGLNTSGAAVHYVTAGYFEGRTADTFDALRYLASYGDLIRAFGANADAATEHYVAAGFHEGRDTDTFNALLYTASYGDLIQAFGLNQNAATLHFVQSGFHEGRSSDRFEAIDYLASHGDLLRAFGSNTDAAIAHYVEHGFFEGRGTDLFDALRYTASYGDLIRAFGVNSQNATAHYVQSGFLEGRNALLFDPAQYLANYADLEAAFGADLESATLHYVQFGYYEGRTFAQLAEGPGTLDKGADAAPEQLASEVVEPFAYRSRYEIDAYAVDSFSFAGVRNMTSPETLTDGPLRASGHSERGSAFPGLERSQPFRIADTMNLEPDAPGLDTGGMGIAFDFNDLVNHPAQETPSWDFA